MKIWGEKSFLEPVKNVIEIDPRLNLRLHICRDCYVTTQNDGLLCLWRSRLFTNSGSITRRSLVQIQPRHQDKAKGSGYAPLHFLGSTIFRRSYLGEVEGGCLNVRETSPRSPTACLPGPARQSFFSKGRLTRLSEWPVGARLSSRIPSRRCRYPRGESRGGDCPRPCICQECSPSRRQCRTWRDHIFTRLP